MIVRTVGLKLEGQYDRPGALSVSHAIRPVARRIFLFLKSHREAARKGIQSLPSQRPPKTLPDEAPEATQGQPNQAKQASKHASKDRYM